MADPNIDQFETLAYGRFAVSQMQALLIGLDPELDTCVKIFASRLAADTDAMEAALAKSGPLDSVTYKPVPGKPDVTGEARDVMRRVVRYAESRPDGAVLASKILQGESLTTVLRRRPVRLAAALAYAAEMVTKLRAQLSEHEAWRKDLTAVREALDRVNESVHKARADRRQVTPEIAAARASWLRRYESTKLVVAGLLYQFDKSNLMQEIFDDLAEVHRAEAGDASVNLDRLI